MQFLIREVHGWIEESLGVRMEAGDWAPPPDLNLGDISIPCFKLAKELKKNPNEVAAELQNVLQRYLAKAQWIAKIDHKGPYLNVFFREDAVFERLLKFDADNFSQFGNLGYGENKTLVIDFSSPNVAKEMGLHHLRSTAIGNALSRIARLQGFKVVNLNYLGDWGLTFGKLYVGHKIFGNESDLESRGISYMLEIYVRFNQEEKKDPALTQKARDAFKKLEEGDEDSLKIWKRFREVSILEFNRLYDSLGIHFDFYDGESLYRNSLDEPIAEITQKLGTRISDGALVCDLPHHKNPILLRKLDGASLYMTRDLAAADDRFRRFHFDLSWYVVAVQQKLHFQQLFDLEKALGKAYAGKMEHISFGMLSFGSKTMKTREGNIIFLEDVLDEARSRALAIINEKNPNLASAEKVAAQVGNGAILFSDLSQNRNGDVKFSWEAALSFEGDTAPFIQYSHARCHSLYAKNKARLGSETQFSRDVLTHAQIHRLLNQLCSFEIYAEKAFLNRDPSQVAHALLGISKAMNNLYHHYKFLDEKDSQKLNSLLKISEMTRKVLAHGLHLLGIEAPEEM